MLKSVGVSLLTAVNLWLSPLIPSVEDNFKAFLPFKNLKHPLVHSKAFKKPACIQRAWQPTCSLRVPKPCKLPSAFVCVRNIIIVIVPFWQLNAETPRINKVLLMCQRLKSLCFTLTFYSYQIAIHISAKLNILLFRCQQLMGAVKEVNWKLLAAILKQDEKKKK